MEEKEEYYNILKKFFEAVSSLDKNGKESLTSRDLFMLMKDKDTIKSDEDIVEFIIDYLRCEDGNEDYNEGQRKRLSEIKEIIEKNSKMNYIYKNIISDGKKYKTKDPYVKFLIHNCNNRNEKIMQQIKLLKNNQIKNLVSLFESLISSILSYFYRFTQNSNDLANQKIKFSDLEHIEKIEEIKDLVVDQKVTSIMHCGFSDWIKKFVDECTKKGYKSIASKYQERLNELIELFERRHLLTHNNGIMNHLYLSKIKGISTNSFKVGDEIKFSDEYLHASIRNVLYMGTVLFINTLDKRGLSRDGVFLGDLNNLGLDYLHNGYYKEAKIIFNYIYENTNKKELYKYNFWLSNLLEDKNTDTTEIEEHFENKDSLNEHDLLAKSILLREDNYIEILESFLQDVTYERVITILNWPIFELIKKEEQFIEFKDKYLYNNFKGV
ncbi:MULTISPECIES: hypothetical protein [Staphylococcus]|uniref:hypothetical protein n=1 Tax=Staphylococcus TaxID=1279 RepID=UPI001C1E87F7|nr:hypothetical protein [Staphylococcus xylosus]MBU6132078.1 hypothetical protein [Staphylococcus xylosus]MEB6203647.1 hypothetical protein [Staphylococcus xylosus]MEB7810986.1 hypothetical protein [Staphylococcus xylosus]MEB7857282.1 hypothetical protein [Staphylococcus xylosus]